MAWVEQVSQRQQKGKVYQDTVNPRLLQSVLTIHDQHYWDGAAWQSCVEDFDTSDIPGYTLRARRLRHRLDTADDGTRRWYPRSGVLTEYVEFGVLQFFNGSVWATLTLGTPVRVGNVITWDQATYSLSLTLTWRRVKIIVVIKQASAAHPIRWAVSLTGLTRNGDQLIGVDTTVVGTIEQPTAVDAAGVAMPISAAYAGGFVTFTGTFTGVTYPVMVDPTLTAGRGSAEATDTYLSKAYTTSNLSTQTVLQVGTGQFTEADAECHTLILFDLSGIPSSPTVASAVLTLNLTDIENAGSGSVNPAIHRIYRMKQAWVSAQTTWTIYSTGNNWGTAGALGAADAEATDIGSRSASNAEALGDVTWTLTPSGVADLCGGTPAMTNNGFKIQADTDGTAGSGRVYASADSATTGARPQLVVSYNLTAAPISVDYTAFPKAVMQQGAFR